MSGAFKMTKLDYYTAKSLIFENIVAIFVIAAIFSYLRSSINTLCFTAAWYAALSETNIFMLQDKNGLERLYTSLSLDSGNIICGRYLYCYIQYFIVLGLTVIIGAGALFIFGDTLQFSSFIEAVCKSLLIFTAVTCIQIPLCFRLPYSKARFWCVIVLMVVVAIVTYTVLNTSSAENAGTGIIVKQDFSSVLCVVISAAVLIISYLTAIYCYRIKRRKN